MRDLRTLRAVHTAWSVQSVAELSACSVIYKLSISGALLPKDEFLRLLAICHEGELLWLMRGQGTTFLDQKYEEVKECSCYQKHHKYACTPYHVVCKL